ncbi:hypothetical protein [Nocardia sp. Marseille-Q1738]
MRKTVAGLLIRLAHRIYRPRVTETDLRGVPLLQAVEDELKRQDPWARRASMSWDLPTSTTIHVNDLDIAKAAAAVERKYRRQQLRGFGR